MKTMPRVCLILLPAFVLWLNACTKNTGDTAAPLQQQQSVETITILPIVTDTPANPANPYDHFGLDHNTLISLASPQLGSASSVYTIIDVFAAQAGITLSQAQRTSIANGVNRLLADTANDYNNIVDSLPFSQGAKHYLRQIKNIAYAIDTPTTYLAYKNSVIAIENTVLTNGTLPAGERKLVLRSAAVARYAMKYWANRYHHDDVLCCNGPVQVTSMGFFRKIERAIKTAIADYVASGEAEKMQMNDDMAELYVSISSWIVYWQLSL